MKLIIPEEAQFEILSATNNAEQVIESAGRTCYKSEDRITGDSAQKFVQAISKRGHLSVIEHAVVTVRFRNVSRGLTHELVRHRLASYSQRSTRYVKEEEMGVVVHTENVPANLVRVMREVEKLYHELLGMGWTTDQARQVLPTGLSTEIVMTANFREWLHVFSLRADPKAHWEIRLLMGQVQDEFAKKWPSVFSHTEVEP